MKANLGYCLAIISIMFLVFLCMILLFLCNATYLGLGLDLKFIESTFYSITYVYKHMQTNYENLREEIEHFQKELQRIPKAKMLLYKGRADIGVLLFDDPNLLKNPNMSRACIGLRIDASETLDDEFLEELENDSGLNSKIALEDTEVITTTYPNKSNLSSSIGRINVRKALKQFLIKENHNELINDGKLVAPLGEIYRDNEILYYLPNQPHFRLYNVSPQYVNFCK